MTHRLSAGLVCLSLMLAITPLDRALGTPCPGASVSERESTLTETYPDTGHSGDSCPDDCQCLCCPGARVLHQRTAAPSLAPPALSENDAPLLKSVNSSDFVDAIFRPPRRP